MSKQAYQLIHMQECINILKYILKYILKQSNQNIFLNIRYIFFRSQLKVDSINFNNSNPI